MASSLSVRAGLQALGATVGRNDIDSFELVLLVNVAEVAGGQTSGVREAAARTLRQKLETWLSESKKSPDDKGRLCYLCTTPRTIFLLDQAAVRQRGTNGGGYSSAQRKESKSKQSTDEDNTAGWPFSTSPGPLSLEERTDAVDGGELGPKGASMASRGVIFEASLDAIDRIVLHEALPDRVAVTLRRSTSPSSASLATPRTAKTDVNLPAVVVLSTCHRKALVDAIMTAHTAHLMHIKGSLRRKHPVFLETIDKQGSNDVAASQSARPSRMLLACRHPAIILYNTLPRRLRDGKSTFYKCGFAFLAPDTMKEVMVGAGGSRQTASGLDTRNRHASMYVWPGDEVSGSARAPLTAAAVADRKHLIFRLMPERSVEPSLSGALRADSTLAFHLWVESFAWSVAASDGAWRDEGGKAAVGAARVGSGGTAAALTASGEDGSTSVTAPPSFFVPERGMYRKKLNIVGDEAMWRCFRVHVYTRHREIGVVGLRRMFAPPRVDAYQDMLLVLKGARQSADKRSNEPHFMQTLERIADSLSPTAFDYKWDTTHMLRWGSAAAPRAELSALQSAPHPTYIDTTLVQARASALLCGHSMYSWLANRSVFRVIEPRLEFGGQSTAALGRHFCRSLLNILGGGVGVGAHAESGKGAASRSGSADRVVEPGSSATVQNPLSIVKRIQTAAAELIDRQGTTSSALRAQLLHRWTRRVASYFAHLVDTLDPNHLTIEGLATAAHCASRRGIPESNRSMLDRVLALLLFAHKAGGVWSLPKDSMYDALTDPRVMRSLDCNTTVLKKLLNTSYIDGLARRKTDRAHGDGSRVMATLLAGVLYTQSEDLGLVRSVCHKLRTCPGTHRHLVDPLMRLARGANAYAQAYALQALRHIVQVDRGGGRMQELCDRGGVEVAMGLLRVSPSRDLLAASAALLSTMCDLDGVDARATRPLRQHWFLDRLVGLLKRQELRQRHDASLLAHLCTLTIHLCSDPGVLYYLVLSGLVKELMEIVAEHDNYFRILIQVTSCLGSVFLHLSLNAKRFPALLLRRHSELNDSLSSHAETLVTTLKQCSTRGGLQIALNILIVLNHVLRTDVTLQLEQMHPGLSAEPGGAGRASSSASQLRREILENLVENHGFEHALIQAKTTATNVQSQVESAGAAAGVWPTIIRGVERKAADLADLIHALREAKGEDNAAQGGAPDTKS